MRKTIKAILANVLSAAMIVGLGAGASITAVDSAKAASLPAPIKVKIGANNSKAYDATTSESGFATDADGNEYVLDITETGTYSFTTIASGDTEDLAEESMYIGLQMYDADGNLLTAMPEDFDIKGVSITVNDNTYDWNGVLVQEGLKEGKGLRIGVVNNYVSKSASKVEEYGYMNPLRTNVNGTWSNKDAAIEIYDGDTVTYNLEVTSGAPAWNPGGSTPQNPSEPVVSNTYNAYLQFQTDVYHFRNSWYDADYGLKSKKLNYTSEIGTNGNKDGEIHGLSADLTDAKIEKNSAEYTVALKGVNLKTLKGDDSTAKASTKFLMLGVSTNIPVSMKGVKATATIKIDGKEIKANVAAPHNKEADYYDFMISNTYSDTQETENCAYPKGKELTVMPTESLEITFKVTGVDFNLSNIGVAKGKTFTSGNFKYKVIKTATKSGSKVTKGTAQLVGLSAKGKKASSLSVPTTASATVNKEKATYNITSIGSAAFKNANVKKVTLSKNIKKIPAKAFQNCKKLASLKLGAKLSSVSKTAFTGCTKTIKVSGTSKSANLKKIKKVYKKAK